VSWCGKNEGIHLHVHIRFISFKGNNEIPYCQEENSSTTTIPTLPPPQAKIQQQQSGNSPNAHTSYSHLL
jgi:hypothetical protein